MKALLFLTIIWSLTSFARPEPWARWLDFDPTQIVVEDPGVVLLAELPRGDINLKNYRATTEDIALYSKNYQVKQGDKKDNPKAPDCTRAEVDAVRLWQTNDVYQKVNTILRTAQKGKVNGVVVEEKFENIILMIASAANCVPQFEGAVVRGDNLPQFVFDQYQVGKYLGFRGFTSTSRGNEITEWFEEHSKQRVFIEKASGADFGVLGVSQWPEEHEILIRPGTVFKVVSKKPVTNSKYILWDFGLEQF